MSNLFTLTQPTILWSKAVVVDRVGQAEENSIFLRFSFGASRFELE